MITERFIGTIADRLPLSLKARVRHTTWGGWAATSLAENRTPGIVYLSGQALLDFDDCWYDEIQAITAAEKHLLTKTREDLEPEALAGRVTIAIDTRNGNCVVGCVIAWALEHDAPNGSGVLWLELGTYVVRRDYRYKSGDQHAMPIGHALFHHLLYTHRDQPVLMTTTNDAVFHIGLRHGMFPVSFHKLPGVIRRSSCICPANKTGAKDNLNCTQLDGQCRVFVNQSAWKRMRNPIILPCNV